MWIALGGPMVSIQHRDTPLSHRARTMSHPRVHPEIFAKEYWCQLEVETETSANIVWEPTEVVLANMETKTISSSESNPNDEQRVEAERLAAILQMATGLAHENYNALQRAHACLELLELDLTHRADLLHLTDRIRAALYDLQRNYEDVKNYAATIVLRYAPINLPELCRSTFNDLLNERQQKEPQLSILDATQNATVLADETRVRQLLRCVFENAIAANPKAKQIEVHAKKTNLHNAEAIELSIRDLGCGLAPETEKQMFEPFFTTKQRGTGLGLAICRRIVDAHHGMIEAKNHSRGGTVVSIKFRCAPL
jgi:two-component system, LuxR family, sensor kinase FixL